LPLFLYGPYLVCAVFRAFACSQESLPLDALRVVDPALFTVRIATGSLALLDHRAFGSLQSLVDLRDFAAMLNLDPQTATPEPRVLKSVVQLNQNNAGVYGTVVQTGTISIGEPVSLVVDTGL